MVSSALIYGSVQEIVGQEYCKRTACCFVNILEQELLIQLLEFGNYCNLYQSSREGHYLHYYLNTFYCIFVAV